MNKQIVIINGKPRVGKDLFVNLVQEITISWNFSSVDKVKMIAKQVGWDGAKDEKSRKFLADLKVLTTEFCDMSFNSIQAEVNRFNQFNEVEFLFLHIREPEEIARTAKEFNAKTLLIKRDSVDDVVSNPSDANVFNYEYDYVIENDGSINELKEKAKNFVKEIRSKKRIFIDWDNCISDTILTVVSLYNEDYSAYPDFKFIYPHQIETWGFEELKLAKREYINMYFNQPRFFEKFNYMDNAKEVLDILKDHFDITVVSSGNPPNLKLKDKWVKENMPYARFEGVDRNIYKDKSHVDMTGEVFIDDYDLNLETSNAATKICFGDTYSWNENWGGIRCFNWYDVLRILLPDEARKFTR